MRARPTSRTIALTAGGALLLLALAACGGSGTDPASTSSTTPSTAASEGASTGGQGDPTAFRDCMAENGVTLPDRGDPPSGLPTSMPSGMPTSMPSGAPGGGGFPGGLPEGVDQATYDAAQAACASLAPQMGPGGAGPGAVDATALAAFTSCLADHDVTVPEGKDPLRDLDRTDPTVQSAVDTCAPLLPAANGQPSPPTS